MSIVPDHQPMANLTHAAEIPAEHPGAFWRLTGVAVFVLVAFFTSILDLTLGRAGKMPIQPTYLALVLVGMLAGIVTLNAVSKHSRGRQLISIFARNSLEVICYFVIAASAIIFSALPGAFWEESGKWIFLIPYGFVVWAGTLIIVSLPVLREAAQRGLTLGFMLLCGSVIYEIFFPGSFSNLESRASGFAGNSNFGALSSCMMCASVLNYGNQRFRMRDMFFLSMTAIAVFATQSRSGLLEFAVLIFFWVGSCFLDKNFSVREATRLAGLSLFMFLVLAMSVSIAFREGSLFSGEGNRFTRMLSGKSVDDGSGDERVGAAMDAVRLISESPLFGHGTGYTRTMSVLPHNQYLQQWVNNGLPGVLAYVLMLLGALFNFYRNKNIRGMCFICVTLIGSVFSHNVLDQRSFIVTFAVLLGCNITRRDSV